MKKIINIFICLILSVNLFSQKSITAGMTGLQMRNAINSNFDSVYIRKQNKVRGAVGCYSTIKSAITASTSGDLVVIYPGIYYESLTLKDGVDLVGVGYVNIEGNNLGAWVLSAGAIKCNIENIKISNPSNLPGNNLLGCVGSTIKFKDCIIQGGSLEVGYINITNGSNITCENCSIYDYGAFLIQNSSSLHFKGRKISGTGFEVKTSSHIDIDVDTMNVGAMYLGQPNPYDLDVKGTIVTWKDSTCLNFKNWENFNKAGNVIAKLRVGQQSKGPGYLSVFQNSKLYLSNSLLCLADLTYGSTIAPFHMSEVIITNSTFGKLDISSKAIASIYNSHINHDRGVYPWDAVGNVYTTTYWQKNLTSHHSIECTSTYNIDLQPLVHIENSTINFMGDNVLGSLQDTVYLKNKEVNLNYISNTSSLPPVPVVHEKNWVTGHSYIKGELIMVYNGHIHDSMAMYIVSNHMAGVFQTDYDDNKIRNLFGANYSSGVDSVRQILYLGAGKIWKYLDKKPKWVGGKTINVGSAIEGYQSDWIMRNVIVNNHDTRWRYHDNWNLWDATGMPGYDLRGCDLYKPELLILENLSVNYVNRNLNYGLSVNGGINISINGSPLSRPIKGYFSNITVSSDWLDFAIIFQKSTFSAKFILPTKIGINNINVLSQQKIGGSSYEWIKDYKGISLYDCNLPIGISTRRELADSIFYGNIPNKIGELVQKQFSGSLTDSAPTEGEINSITGLTPATAGVGFRFTIKDTTGTTRLYFVESDGTNWYFRSATEVL